MCENNMCFIKKYRIFLKWVMWRSNISKRRDGLATVSKDKSLTCTYGG